jgi:transposase
MAFLKAKQIHGRTYWYVVESRRVDGRVKTVNLAYLGKAEDILARWRESGRAQERLRSYSHGGVAVMLSLADRLDLASLIDRHARASRPSRPRRSAVSVGRALVAAAVGRVLHPTSKRGWATWAEGTTFGKLWKFDPSVLTSQYFWDQMDRLPVKSLPSLQAELGRRVLDTFEISTQSLFYDTTNFYTFIDSRNRRCDIAQRGKNKQKRNDLRQFHLGLLVARDGWVPLLAKFFRGNLNDVTTFPDALAAIRSQCDELGIPLEHATLVADKGNISAKNWRLLDASGIRHVVSLVPSHHKEWSARPIDEFDACDASDVGAVRVLRSKETVAGRERTLVVLDSPTLRDGQLRGLDQHLRRPIFALACLTQTLRTATRRRKRAAIEKQISGMLTSAATKKLIKHELRPREGRQGFWDLDWWIDMDVYRHLREREYGRRVLATDQHEWSTPDIVRAYWGQSEAEHVFEEMKNPDFLSLRPQYHWTNQKVEVHGLLCVVGYLLAALVRRHARRMGYTEGLPRLLEMLNGVRAVLKTEVRARAGRPRVTWQLEDADPHALELYRALVDKAYELGPTGRRA